jgi:NAD(P)-dependent dehydrogenase (short-subunit alcohol dehydrogenase family)
VAAVCHKQKAADELEEALGDAKPELFPICDVTVEEQVEALFQQVVSELGTPEILLNIVGGYAAHQPIEEIRESTWDRMMQMNLKSAFLCSKHALAHMVPADYGRIVNISSKITLDLPGNAAAPAVAKSGVSALTGCIAHQVKGTGVAASAVMPSIIDSPGMREAMPKAKHERWVKPDQIADTLLYLASEPASAVNGAIVPCFGGM